MGDGWVGVWGGVNVRVCVCVWCGGWGWGAGRARNRYATSGKEGQQVILDPRRRRQRLTLRQPAAQLTCVL